jgi:penicillin amidase
VKRALRAAAGALLILLLAIVGAIVLIGAGSLPRTTGGYELDGLDGPVEIERDVHGVPHIRAASERDAYRALGFVQAQDRLWQMEFQRRVGQGRLAELVGSPGLPADRYLRTLGLYNAAQASLESLDPSSRALLDAYVQGINDWIEHRDRLLPPEFWIFWHSPEPWKPADSAVWIKMMALNLDGDMDGELQRLALRARLTPQQIADLWPGMDAPRDQSAQAPAGWAERLRASLPDLPSSGIGSNAFAVGASRSASDGALLAGDPHLQLRTPGVWYLVDMTAPGLRVTGATMPGMPFVVIGRTPTLAWSLTTTHADVQDLFVETVDPADGERYLAPGGSLPFARREERILVKGGASETLRLRATRHGPVISELPGRNGEPARPVSLAWTVLDPADSTIRAGFGLPHAGDLNGLRATLADYRNPVQNFIAADSHGRVGLIVAGAVPVRRGGNGTMPADGASGRFDWTGTVPADELPTLLDPPGGTVANGNNRVTEPGYPHLIAAYWPSDWRRARIDALLSAEERLDPADLVRIQRDLRSGFAVDMLPTLLAAQSNDPATVAMRDAMRGWDGTMAGDRWEAGLFLAWAERLSRMIREDELGPLASGLRGLRGNFLAHVLQNRPAWCDDVRTEPVETCAMLAGRALQQAQAALVAATGPDRGRWTLRHLQTAAMPHATLGQVPVLGALFGNQAPKAGDPDTVDVAWATTDDALVRRTVTIAASLRIVADLAEPEGIRIVTASGQSGHPWSRWFADGVARWTIDRRIVLPAAQRPDRMSLVPARDG